MVVVALVLVILTLPSALNLPLANPGQSLEYAPVPGNNPGPAQGNIAALGLGSGSTTASGGIAGGNSGAGAAGSFAGVAGHPSDKACVGSPPRQTEDPLSPPCVPYFDGDNGGATHTGVTGSEVTVLFRMAVPSGFSYSGDSHPDTTGPPTGYYDMDNQTDVDQFFAFVYLHDWEVYFNHRYQTYKRKVHFLVYNYNQPSSQSTYTPANAHADASDNWNAKHPFATLQNQHFDISGDYPADYSGFMADHGALSFGSYGFTEAQASQYPGLFWSYPPTLESQAQEYASYVCERIVKPGQVTFSGNGDTGATRKYGLLLTDDASASATQQRQQLTVQYLKSDCAIQFTDTEHFHYSDSQAEGPQSGWGVQNMATMRSKGVTTIIWPGGAEIEDMTAASQQHWYPEWVLEGDGQLDGLGGGDAEIPDEISHAWVTTPQPLIDNPYGVDAPCLEAIEEVDPQIDRSHANINIACSFYEDLRQLFTGIQLAGPRLTPAAMNQGFHAIPARPSTSPYVPSCYYLPGDYTCVKDAAAEWWDPNAHPNGYANSQIGCWRMWRNGQRYLTGEWPPGDVTQDKDNNDVCNLFAGLWGYTVRST